MVEDPNDSRRVSIRLKLDLPQQRSGEIYFSTLNRIFEALTKAERELREAGRLGDHVSELMLAGVYEGSTDLAIGQDYIADYVRDQEVPLRLIQGGMAAVTEGEECPSFLSPVDDVLQGVIAAGGRVQFGVDGRHWSEWAKRQPMAAAKVTQEPRWRVRLIGKLYEINYKSGSARLDIEGHKYRILKGLTEAQVNRIDDFRRARAEVLVRSVDADANNITQVLSIDEPTGDIGIYSSPLVRPAVFEAVSDRVIALAQLQDGWYGPRSLAPSDKAVRGARRMFTDIFDSMAGEVEQPGVVPGPGGEMQLEWHHSDERYLELLVRADGRWEFLVRDERSEREGLVEYERALRLAVMYMRGLS